MWLVSKFLNPCSFVFSDEAKFQKYAVKKKCAALLMHLWELLHDYADAPLVALLDQRDKFSSRA